MRHRLVQQAQHLLQRRSAGPWRAREAGAGAGRGGARDRASRAAPSLATAPRLWPPGAGVPLRAREVPRGAHLGRGARIQGLLHLQQGGRPPCELVQQPGLRPRRAGAGAEADERDGRARCAHKGLHRELWAGEGGESPTGAEPRNAPPAPRRSVTPNAARDWSAATLSPQRASAGRRALPAARRAPEQRARGWPASTGDPRAERGPRPNEAALLARASDPRPRRPRRPAAQRRHGEPAAGLRGLPPEGGATKAHHSARGAQRPPLDGRRHAQVGRGRPGPTAGGDPRVSFGKQDPPGDDAGGQAGARPPFAPRAPSGAAAARENRTVPR